MLFRFSAECMFDADDVDGALTKLSEHFDSLKQGEAANERKPLLTAGIMELRPMPDYDGPVVDEIIEGEAQRMSGEDQAPAIEEQPDDVS